MIHFLEDGTPAAPEHDNVIKPAHYCPTCRRFHASNYLAVSRADNGVYVLKQARSFNMWDNSVFDRWVGTLSGAQADEVSRVMAVLDDSVTDLLDQDWTVGTESKVRAAMAKLNGLVAKESDVKKLTDLYVDSMRALIANAPENYSAKNGFLSAFDMGKKDEGAARFFAGMLKANTDEAFGKYMDPDATEAAIKLANAAIQHGRSADDIANALSQFVRDDIPMGKRGYAQLVADQAMTRARSWSEARSMQEAGFSQYQVRAVYDEATCKVCRYMDGRILDLGGGIKIAENAMKKGVKNLDKTNPWIRSDGDALKVKNTTIATVRRSGEGNIDDPGEYDDKGADLHGLGVALPPFHPRCRCLLVPVFTTRWGAEPPSKESKPPPMKQTILDILEDER